MLQLATRQYRFWNGNLARADHTEGVIEVHHKDGDSLLFVDAICHGASSRSSPGERRAVIYRYGPKWATTRYGYRHSNDLLARVTLERRMILQPLAPRLPGQSHANERPPGEKSS